MKILPIIELNELILNVFDEMEEMYQILKEIQKDMLNTTQIDNLTKTQIKLKNEYTKLISKIEDYKDIIKNRLRP